MTPPVTHRYIVVEGPIGCGNTSLAIKLAIRMGATTLLEDQSIRSSTCSLSRHAPLCAAHALFFLFSA